MPWWSLTDNTTALAVRSCERGTGLAGIARFTQLPLREDLCGLIESTARIDLLEDTLHPGRLVLANQDGVVDLSLAVLHGRHALPTACPPAPSKHLDKSGRGGPQWINETSPCAVL